VGYLLWYHPANLKLKELIDTGELGRIQYIYSNRVNLGKKGATLGANCTIVCGTTFGRYAFIGAGAVVTKDVPDYGLAVGSPARITGWVCECGLKLG
jgi:acetyltransferase-like isoleucine patch superfamily enzyme